jgi:hypothetical protein
LLDRYLLEHPLENADLTLDQVRNSILESAN